MTFRRNRGLDYSGMSRTVTTSADKGLLNILFLRTNDVVQEIKYLSYVRSVDLMICAIIPSR
jgi:hypothetical protein